MNENIHVESVRDEVEALVMDAEVLEEILRNSEPEKKAKEISFVSPKWLAKCRRG